MPLSCFDRFRAFYSNTRTKMNERNWKEKKKKRKFSSSAFVLRSHPSHPPIQTAQELGTKESNSNWANVETTRFLNYSFGILWRVFFLFFYHLEGPTGRHQRQEFSKKFMNLLGTFIHGCIPSFFLILLSLLLSFSFSCF